MGIDRLSIITTPLLMKSGSTNLAKGTGFFALKDDVTYLITNWHNVSGCNPETQKHISPDYAEPDSLQITLHEKISKADTIETTATKSYTYPLTDSGVRLWQGIPCSPQDEMIDVVAIPITIPNDVQYGHLEQISFDKYHPRVSDDVFIIGYPWGLNGGSEALPLWKKGSIASEPSLHFKDKLQVIIDANTKPSMSGSPVVCKYSGAYNASMDFPDAQNVTKAGRFTTFLGVYSGRLRSKEKEDKGEVTDMGIVWKQETIDMAITAAKNGNILTPI